MFYVFFKLYFSVCQCIVEKISPTAIVRNWLGWRVCVPNPILLRVFIWFCSLYFFTFGNSISLIGHCISMKLQLGSSSRAKHGGAYFSAVFGRKFNPTTVLRPCQPLACYWRVAIAAAPTLFTTSAKHYGSRCCGWSDLSLLCTSICDTEMAADTCCLKGVCCATFLYGRVCGCRVDNLGKV